MHTRTDGFCLTPGPAGSSWSSSNSILVLRLGGRSSVRVILRVSRDKAKAVHDSHPPLGSTATMHCFTPPDAVSTGRARANSAPRPPSSTQLDSSPSEAGSAPTLAQQPSTGPQPHGEVDQAMALYLFSMGQNLHEPLNQHLPSSQPQTQPQPQAQAPQHQSNDLFTSGLPYNAPPSMDPSCSSIDVASVPSITSVPSAPSEHSTPPSDQLYNPQHLYMPSLQQDDGSPVSSSGADRSHDTHPNLALPPALSNFNPVSTGLLNEQ